MSTAATLLIRRQLLTPSLTRSVATTPLLLAAPTRQRWQRPPSRCSSSSSSSSSSGSSSGSSGRWPEHVIVRLPKLSPSCERAELLAWHVVEGGALGMTDLLYDVATDTLVEEVNPALRQRLVLEVEAHEEGFIAKHLVRPPGEDAAGAAAAAAPVVLRPGDAMAVFVEREEDVAAFAAFGAADVHAEDDDEFEFLYQAYTKKAP